MIDWKEDPWFVKYHYDKLTEEFKEWWRTYYGPSTQFDNENERHEYWVRCAFALAGWKAATSTA